MNFEIKNDQSIQRYLNVLIIKKIFAERQMMNCIYHSLLQSNWVKRRILSQILAQ